MSALVHHLRFLRPLRSAVIVAVFATMPLGLGSTLFAHDPDIARISACLVALPLLVGVFLAGAALEPLHRPFALLLPGIRARQLLFSARAIALAALAIVGFSIRVAPAVPPVAALGLVGALLTIPFLGSPRLRSHLPTPLTEFGTWLAVSLAFGLGLTRTLNAAPWFFLAAGATFAVFALRRAFCRTVLRARAHTPLLAFQTQLCFQLFNPAVATRWQAESRSQTKDSNNDPVPRLPTWRARAVGPGTREWLSVLRYLHLGAWRNESRFALPAPAVAAMICMFAVFPAIGLYAGQPDYWTALAHSIRFDFSTQLQFALAAGLVFRVSAPAITLPISRAFLGRIGFWHSVAIWLSAVLFSFTMVCVPSVVGQLASGHAFPAYGLPALVVRSLFLAAVLPLAIAANLRPARRPLVFVATIAIFVLVSAPTRAFLADYTFEPVVIGTLLAAIAGSLALLRHRLHRHYATCDLPAGTTPRTIG